MPSQHWLAEALRLREEHWGPLDDSDAVRQARLADGSLADRILLRARLLGRREGLDALIARWRQGAALTFVILGMLAIMVGAVTALGALGDGTRPVNVLWALGALLGLHAFTFLLWLASFALGPRHAPGLGKAWLWATRKLARGPDAALVPQALMNLLARAGALRWLFGTVSHLLWLAALCAALATLLAVLSTASYRFVWATTLLEPEAFVHLTAALGWLPSLLGFPAPDEAVVRASGDVGLPAAAQVQWSLWLLGIVVCYGVLPRLAAGLLCLVRTARALRGLRIDPALPGFATLQDRLQPPAPLGIDREAGLDSTAPVWASHALPDLGHHPVLAAVELPADLPWPPAALPANAVDAGNLDSRETRNALLDALAKTPAPRLLLACDAGQTPDRGSLALIAELSRRAGATRIWLHGAPEHDRAALWRDRLQAAGLPPEAIVRDTDQPLRWLESVNG